MGFLDVPPSHWANRDVNELSGLNLFGYGKMIEGIPFNIFENAYPMLDKVYVVGSSGQIEFDLGTTVTDSEENPITVKWNDVPVGYAKLYNSSGTTKVVLKKVASPNSIVRITMPGIPDMYTLQEDPLGNPKGFSGTPIIPNKNLNVPNGYTYLYSPEYPLFTENVVWKGIKLKRVPFCATSNDLPPNGDMIEYAYVAANTKFWHWDGIQWTAETIPKESLMYSISDGGTLVVPFNLYHEILTVSYLYISASYVIKNKTETVIPTQNAQNMVYTNRVFPGTYVSMAQAVALLDRMRVYLLLKFTKYADFHDVIEYKDIEDSVFVDVRGLSPTKWWWPYLCNLETLQMKNGSFLLNYDEHGYPITDDSDRPENPKIYIEDEGVEYAMYRADIAWLLNRFRKYMLEILV